MPVRQTQGMVNNIESMELRSPDFDNNELIPARYTCDSEDINPELEISGVEKEVKSLALIVEDPDASTGNWVHWTLWNIDPSIDLIPAGSIPKDAVEGMTDFGRPGYGGPCPHEGLHHYHFKLFGLDTPLDLTAPMRASDLKEAMEGHIISETTLVGLYARHE